MTPKLNSTQNATLKAAILANSAVNQLPANGDSADFIAKVYNGFPVTDFLVWNTAVPVNTVLDAIDFTKYTPTDSALDTDLANVAVAKSNRLLAVQTKQMNLQMLTIGRTSLNASRANIRASLRDAVIQLPTGAAGAATSAAGANGVNVLNACTRKATVAEQTLASGSASLGGVTANLLTSEGELTQQEVMLAMGW